jgi:PAS domain S-box-containing protein
MEHDPIEHEAFGLPAGRRPAGTGGSAAGGDRGTAGTADVEERRYRTIVEHSPDLIFEIDSQGRFTYFSASCEAVTGYRAEELLDSDFRDVVHPKDRPIAERAFRNIARGRESVDVEFRFAHADGTWHVHWDRGVPYFDEDGAFVGAMGIVRDVTEQREAEQRLQAALAEERQLMRELNHRVKNNLSTVASLVSLKDSAVGEAADLSDIRHQIRAIQKIHERLQHSSHITHVELSEYLNDVAKSVFDSFGSPSVVMETDIASITVHTKTAVPLGLIVNELATNAVQHGFTAETEARFHMAMRESDDGQSVELVISNTGRPFPDDIALSDAGSLGLQLVSALVEQLEGALSLEREPSPRFRIRIPKRSLS